METYNSSIVSISIFYNSNFWLTLIADCLNPYILALKQNEHITGAFIAFNYHQGHNIRIALDFKANEAVNRSLELNKLLTDFIETNPSPNIGFNYIGNQLFMDFPNNSCQHNLFFVAFEKPAVKLQLLVSEKILSVFSINQSDDSSVFTFLLHLILAFTKVWEKDGSMLGLKITQLLCSKNEVSSADELNVIYGPYLQLFMESQEMMFEIYKDATSNDRNINNWKEIKDQYQVYLQTRPFISETDTILTPLDLVVANQIGLNDQSLLAIYFLTGLILKHFPKEIVL